jgi:hypothetical protein
VRKEEQMTNRREKRGKRKRREEKRRDEFDLNQKESRRLSQPWSQGVKANPVG